MMINLFLDYPLSAGLLMVGVVVGMLTGRWAFLAGALAGIVLGMVFQKFHKRLTQNQLVMDAQRRLIRPGEEVIEVVEALRAANSSTEEGK